MKFKKSWNLFKEVENAQFDRQMTFSSLFIYHKQCILLLILRLEALHPPQFPVHFYRFPPLSALFRSFPSQFSGPLPKCSNFQVQFYRLSPTLRFTLKACPHDHPTHTLSEIRLYHIFFSTRFFQLNSRIKEALLFQPFSKIRNI